MVLQICRKYVVIEKFNNMSLSFRCPSSSEDIRDGKVRARAGIEQMAATSWRQCRDDNNGTLSQLFSSSSADSSVFPPVDLSVSVSATSVLAPASRPWSRWSPWDAGGSLCRILLGFMGHSPLLAESLQTSYRYLLS